MAKKAKRASKKAAKKAGTRRKAAPAARSRAARPNEPPDAPKLLSGGNPQIAKGYGDDVVQSYIAAMPEWKRDVGRRLDALITTSLPGVRKAVKWNSPFYGVSDDQMKGGVKWFMSFHCFVKYVKVAFFTGALLKPLPPGESKQTDVRYLDVRETDDIDEAQFGAWVKQASRLPGWDGAS